MRPSKFFTALFAILCVVPVVTSQPSWLQSQNRPLLRHTKQPRFDVCDGLDQSLTHKARKMSGFRGKKEYFDTLSRLHGNQSFINREMQTLGYRATGDWEVVTLGDSVIREIHASLEICMPQSKAIYHKEVLLKEDTVKPSLKKMRDLNPNSPVYIIGGIGLHYLLRYEATYKHPFKEHFNLFSASIKVMKEYAQAHQQTIVMVGTLPVESDIIHMAPEKHDWSDFYDLSLAAQWAEGEALVFDEIVDSSKECMFFLNPAKLVDKCPGIRCDGMHFGIPVEEADCLSSLGLWEILISELFEDPHFQQCASQSLEARKEENVQTKKKSGGFKLFGGLW